MGDRITIEWKSFLLRVEPKAPSREEFVTYTNSWLRPAEMEPKARFQVWASDAPPPSSSLPAQVAAKTMELHDPDSTFAYHRALLTAYFSDNRDISNPDVLADVAAECGVERSGFVAAMQEHNQALTQAVIDDHNSAVDNGVTAVPTVVIDNMMPVPGAQEVDAYQTWIEAILSRR